MNGAPAKRALNLRKHRIAFEDAITIFEQPRLEGFDVREDYGEDRIVAYGELRGVVIVVVYTWRRENRRIISARQASKQEREAFNKAIQGGQPS